MYYTFLCSVLLFKSNMHCYGTKVSTSKMQYINSKCKRGFRLSADKEYFYIKCNGLQQGSQTQILSRAALAIKNVLRVAHWRKNGSAGRIFQKKSLKDHNHHICCKIWLYLIIFMALLTTFLPKQHKNSNISIKIVITYIFWEGRGPHGHPWWAVCLRPLG